MSAAGAIALAVPAIVLATDAGQAAGAAAGGPRGAVAYASQDPSRHLSVQGWAYDKRRPHKHVVVSFWSGRTLLGRATASRPDHRFRKTFTLHRKVGVVTARSHGVGRTTVVISRKHVRQLRTTTGQRIVRIARHYVGRTPYVYGGSTPRSGFDCSGYTRWVYAKAHAGRLPHNAAAQSHVPGMKRIPAKRARPGDLVFYNSGGGIYHVAIYAGRHTQYSASTPSTGIRRQHIWSSDVSYGHLSR